MPRIPGGGPEKGKQMKSRSFLGALTAGAAALVLAGCMGASPDVGKTGASGGASSLPQWVTSPPSGGGFAYGVGSARIYADPATALNQAQDTARR
ncbi:MAG TPA: hypothetical protein VKA48_08830, partial [Gammaproteobacteria bacterium]|nr:hypothetical protein [Gammaproteobacteria bacterium]